MPRQSVVPGFRFDAKRKRATFEVTLPRTGGRVRRRKRIKASTRDEALALFRRFRDAVLADRAAEPPLFSDFIKRFWPLIRMRLGKKTAVNENSVVENILVPFFGSYRLEKVNAALIRDFVALLRSRSYAAPTINGAVSVLRKILNDAVDREVIKEFPARGRLPKEKEPILRLEFSREEKTRFLDAFDDGPAFRRHFSEHRSAGRVVSSPHFGNAPRVFGGGLRPEGEALRYYFERFREMKPLFIVALETGLRRSDLLGLRWSSVDFSGGWTSRWWPAESWALEPRPRLQGDRGIVHASPGKPAGGRQFALQRHRSATFIPALQQVRWPPTSIGDTPEDALNRLFVLPGSRYDNPEFSGKWAVAPAAIGFAGDGLGAQHAGSLFVGAARTFSGF